MRESSLAYAMIIMSLVGFLVATFESGRLEDGGRSEHRNTSTGANVVNSTTLGQSKLLLKFCMHNVCGDDLCFCCQTLPGVPCFAKKEDCWDKCPTCDPNCPPSQETYLLHN
uniref:Uncharacterized protein n=1 Tax=Avena sativa TaxID=4498 RepID=A0ACD5UBG0_AVESA